MPDSPRSILFFLTTSEIGGTERSFLSMARCLTDRGWRVAVGSLESSGPLLGFAREDGLDAFSPEFRGFHRPAFALRLNRFLRRGKFDVVMAAGLRGKLSVIPLAAVAGVPVRISAVRGVDGWKRPWHMALEKALEPLTTAWIANSQAAQEWATQKEGKPRDRVHMLHQGLAPPVARKLVSPGAQRRPDRWTLGVLANLRPGKGHEFLLRSLKPLLDERPELYIQFLGKDYLDGRIQQVIGELELEKRVALLGFVADVGCHLTSEVDMLVLPSESESFPTSLIEGMVAGVPIAATRVGGIPELISHEKTGLLFDPGDARACREAVSRVMNDEDLRRRLALAAYVEARDRYDLEGVTEAYERLFLEYLKRA